jgi:hypothetical protein
MAITNFATADAASNALVNAAARVGITPSVQLSASQLESSVLANVMQGQLGGSSLATGPAAGITSGDGTICETAVVSEGGFKKTTFVIDLTGLASSTTDLDIIGNGAEPAYIGRITTAESGIIIGGTITCLEVPAGGVTTIDWYAATEGTGAFDTGIGTLTETVMHTASGASTLGLVVPIVADSVAANAYLYIVGGAAGTAAAYTAGRFRVELIGV